MPQARGHEKSDMNWRPNNKGYNVLSVNMFLTKRMGSETSSPGTYRMKEDQMSDSRELHG